MLADRLGDHVWVRHVLAHAAQVEGGEALQLRVGRFRPLSIARHENSFGTELDAFGLRACNPRRQHLNLAARTGNHLLQIDHQLNVERVVCRLKGFKCPLAGSEQDEQQGALLGKRVLGDPANVTGSERSKRRRSPGAPA